MNAEYALAPGSFLLRSQRSHFENRLKGSVLFIRSAGGSESVDAELDDLIKKQAKFPSCSVVFS